MQELLTISALNGVLYGMLLFLMASGLTLIFSMMGVLNFAHASFYMLGAFFGFQMSQIVGFWPAFIIAPVLVGGIGALVERHADTARPPGENDGDNDAFERVVNRLAELTAGKGGVRHRAEEVIDGVDLGEIEWRERNQSVF